MYDDAEQLFCNLLWYPLGAAINSQSIEGGTPLYVAAEYGRVTVVELVSSLISLPAFTSSPNNLS